MTDIAAPRVSTRVATRDRVAMLVFTTTSFLGSALLFLIQPMVGRLLLPRAGGSASLWNTAMVFFQLTLLVGYLFAHLSTTKLGVQRHRYVHLVVLAAPLAILPVAVPDGWALDGSRPVLGAFGVLAVMVGLPFFALATASPSLQRWFAQTSHPQAHDPYFLYAAGNVGSIGALLGYPLIIEPRLGLTAQTQLFTGVYVAFLAATTVCAFVVGRAPDATRIRPVERETLTWRRRGRWVALAAVPSALLLGVTRHLATDVASFPLLWVLPLTFYLLSFVIAFRAGSERYLANTNLLVLIGSIGLALSFIGMSLVAILVLHLGWFLAAALLGHLRLAADRPPVGNLTEFYAWLSVGGALGGATVALLAPMVFDRIWEYPIAIVAAVALAVPPKLTSRRVGMRPGAIVAVGTLLSVAAWLRATEELRLTAAALGLAGLIAYISTQKRSQFAGVIGAMMLVVIVFQPTNAIYRDRSFFGSYEVREQADGVIELVMGTTIHGQQLPGRAGEPSSYYHPAGPLGTIFSQRGTGPMRTGAIGLGAGEISGYAQPGDSMTFFEIDPVVAEIATDPRFFTHLAVSDAKIDIQIGDGRILLEASTETFDVLVVDAFNSDAIPVHLLTLEAVQGYFDRTADDGIVLIHISNRYFDLAPALGRIAEELGVDARVFRYTPSAEERAAKASASHWVALVAPGSSFELEDRWKPIEAQRELWTDDYSDILGALDLSR